MTPEDFVDDVLFHAVEDMKEQEIWDSNSLDHLSTSLAKSINDIQSAQADAYQRSVRLRKPLKIAHGDVAAPDLAASSALYIEAFNDFPVNMEPEAEE